MYNLTDLALYNHPVFRAASLAHWKVIEMLMKELDMSEEQAVDWCRAWSYIREGD